MNRLLSLTALALAALSLAPAHARDGSDDDSSDDNLLATVPTSACSVVGTAPAGATFGGVALLTGSAAATADTPETLTLRCPLPLSRSGSSGGDRLATVQVSYLDSGGSTNANATVAIEVFRTAVDTTSPAGFEEARVCFRAPLSSGAATGATVTVPCASAIGGAYYHADVTLTVRAEGAQAGLVGLRASR